MHHTHGKESKACLGDAKAVVLSKVGSCQEHTLKLLDTSQPLLRQTRQNRTPKHAKRRAKHGKTRTPFDPFTPLQRIVGIENCAPSLMPLGQRAVTVLVLV